MAEDGGLDPQTVSSPNRLATGAQPRWVHLPCKLQMTDRITQVKNET